MSPDERKQPEHEELVSLNADNLDADQLDEQDLEEVAGGDCGTFSCGINRQLPDTGGTVQ